MLPLWFKNEADYDKIKGTDKISILGLKEFAPGKDLSLEVTHKDGSKDTIPVTHTFNEGQIGWFRAGSGELSDDAFSVLVPVLTFAFAIFHSPQPDGQGCQLGLFRKIKSSL
jgi:hypothetical protein